MRYRLIRLAWAVVVGLMTAAPAPNVGPMLFGQAATFINTSNNLTGSLTLQSIGQLHTSQPLGFLPNTGRTASTVRYYSHGPGYAIYFTPEEIVFAFTERPTPSPERGATTRASLRSDGPRSASSMRGSALALQFLGGNARVSLAASRELAGKVNYLIGNDPSKWQTRTPMYRQITYRELWPGIDMVVRAEGGRLKSEFVLQPGAKVEGIRVGFRGADSVSLDEAGNLRVKTALGEIVEERPKTYQEIRGTRLPVASRFILERRPDGQVAYGFEATGKYNPRFPLVIDPLLYSTYLGGRADDQGLGIAVDTGGNVYVTGFTESPDFPATLGAFDTSCGTDGNCNPIFGLFRRDAFVVKFDVNGNLLYATYLGGSRTDTGGGPFSGGGAPPIAIDSAGHAYVVGYTESPDFPTTAGAFDRALGGFGDAFFAKLSADGASLLYSSYLGGSDNAAAFGPKDFATAVAIDRAGNAYVTGRTASLDFPIKNAFQSTYQSSPFFDFRDAFGGGGDAFVTKIDPRAFGAASLSSSTYLGGRLADQGLGIAVDASGSAYVTGVTTSRNFPVTAGAFDMTYNFGFTGDAFIARLDPSGATLLYGTYLGGGRSDQANGIAVDASGHAYVVGTTESADAFAVRLGLAAFPTTPDAYDRTYNGRFDAFAAKLDTMATGAASLLWSSFLGGSDADTGQAIAVDAANHVYVAGRTRSFGAFDPLGNDSVEAFVARLNRTGSGLLFGTRLGGDDFDAATSVAVDSSGIAYVTGFTFSTDFPTTAGAFDPTCGSDGACDQHPVFRFRRFDAFVVKLTAEGGSQ